MKRGHCKMMKHDVSYSRVNETCSACVYLIKMQPLWFDNSNNPYWKYQFNFDILFIPTEDSPGGPCRSDPGRVCEGTWPPLLLRRWRTRLGRSRPSPARPCPGRTTAGHTGGPGPGHLWVSWSFWSAPWTADQETNLRNSRNSSRFHVPKKSTGWVPSLRKARPYNASSVQGSHATHYPPGIRTDSALRNVGDDVSANHEVMKQDDLHTLNISTTHVTILLRKNYAERSQ